MDETRKITVVKIEGDTISPFAKINLIIPIDKGELFIMPTDTLWGLGVSPVFPDAVKELFKVKRRPPDQPLPLLVSDMNTVEFLIGSKPSKLFTKLAGKFWPGPLTIITQSSRSFADGIAGPGGKIGLRMPKHPIAIEIIDATREKYLAVTSANRHGKPIPSTVESLRKEFQKDVFLLIQSDHEMLNMPSTVVDITSGKVEMIRKGALSSIEILSKI